MIIAQGPEWKSMWPHIFPPKFIFPFYFTLVFALMEVKHTYFGLLLVYLLRKQKIFFVCHNFSAFYIVVVCHSLPHKIYYTFLNSSFSRIGCTSFPEQIIFCATRAGPPLLFLSFPSFTSPSRRYWQPSLQYHGSPILHQALWGHPQVQHLSSPCEASSGFQSLMY